jgi:hypothetical protein
MKRIDEIKKEIELSNIRLSSNDDVEYALAVIDELIGMIKPKKKNAPYGVEHDKNCGCTYCN